MKAFDMYRWLLAKAKRDWREVAFSGGRTKRFKKDRESSRAEKQKARHAARREVDDEMGNR